MSRVRDGVPTPLASRRLAGRAVRTVRAGIAARPSVKLRGKLRGAGFPYTAPTIPRGVEVPAPASTLGADFDTEWARTWPARAVRRTLIRGPLRLGMRVIADPTVVGLDRLEDLRRLGDDAPPLIFVPNHHSHLDTPLMVTAVPDPWGDKLVVAAAADYFFDTRVQGTFAALSLNALPIDREATGRKSADQIRELIDDGWSLVIDPEGGRSPDGWGQQFKGGAAYLSGRTGAAVVPVFIEGTGGIYGKGLKRRKPGTSKVVFGAPLRPHEGESTRRFGARIEAAVAALGDETLTDYWSARQRAASGASPKLTGPAYTGWRRQWELTEQRRRGTAGIRRLRKRRWPKLD
jgi:1-acyl-sn-glycerol-3-phosphate acyltransferase